MNICACIYIYKYVCICSTDNMYAHVHICVYTHIALSMRSDTYKRSINVSCLYVEFY